MEKSSCEFGKTCPNQCNVSFKIQCVTYCQAVASYIVRTIGQEPTLNGINQAKDLKKGKIYITTSKQKAAEAILKSLQRKMQMVKLYKFSTAIESSLSDEVPQESLVYIDTVTKYKEVEKGMQVIDSFSEKLVDSSKIVVIRVNQGYQVSEGQILL